MSNKVADFFKDAFEDMKESAKAQHEADKAEFAAVKAESKARWEEAKAMGSPEYTKRKFQAERSSRIENANQRLADAQERINSAKNK